MGGRMGGDRVTLHDVKIVSVDEATNTIFIKGAIPGARNGLVLLSGNGDLELGLPEAKVEEPVVAEETANSEEGSEATTETTEVTETPVELVVESEVVEEVKEAENPEVETKEAEAQVVVETAEAETKVTSEEEVEPTKTETPSNS